MKMKMILAAVVALALAGCSSVKPDYGQEAVLVKKPWIFGHGGVDPTPVTTGRTYTALSTDAVYVRMTPVEWNVPFNDLMTKDGVPMHFDASIVVQVTDSVRLIDKFGTKWFENNVDSVFRNLVRQAVRKHGMNEVAIDTVAIDAIDREVSSGLTAYINKAKIPVKVIRMTVGKANPPDSVKNQRIATAQEEQRALTQAKTEQAEIKRKAAEAARADADNAYRTQMNLSPEQFVELQRINMMQQVCAEGKCTFIVGNGSALVNAR